MNISGAVSRSGAGVFSQVLNSGSNLLLSIVVAREVSAADYGGWAIGYAFFVMLLAVNRALVTTPVLILRPKGDGQNILQTALRDSVSAATGLGVASGSIIFAVALIAFDGPIGEAMVALGCLLPALLVHDTLRYTYIKEGRPLGAAILDLVWVLAQAALFALILYAGIASVLTLTAAWGLSAFLGASVGLFRRRWFVRWSGLIDHLKRHAWESRRLLIDSLLTTVSANATPAVVGALVGLSAAGYLRAGQTLMGVVGLFILGVTPVMTVEAIRMLEQGRSAWSILWGWSAVVAVVAVMFGAMVLSLPERVGESLFGESWSGARSVLVPLILQTVLRGPFSGVPILLKSAARLNELVHLRIYTSIATLTLPALGAAFWGLRGAVWCLVLAAFWAAGHSVHSLSRAISRGLIK